MNKITKGYKKYYNKKIKKKLKNHQCQHNTGGSRVVHYREIHANGGTVASSKNWMEWRLRSTMIRRGQAVKYTTVADNVLNKLFVNNEYLSITDHQIVHTAYDCLQCLAGLEFLAIPRHLQTVSWVFLFYASLLGQFIVIDLVSFAWST